MKYYYFAVIDDYEYHKVTKERYNSFVDFVMSIWQINEICEPVQAYIDGESSEFLDGLTLSEIFSDIFGYDTHYIVIDEDGNEIENTISEEDALKKFINVYLDNGKE